MKPFDLKSHESSSIPTAPPEIDLAALPRCVDRRAAAEIITRYFFPVSHRTIESWPLVARRVNGRALYDTAALLAFAKSKVDAVPAIMQWHRKPPGSEPARAAGGAVNEARRVMIAEMRQAVEAVSSERQHPEHQGGVRWAKARMLHTLEQMEAAIY